MISCNELILNKLGKAWVLSWIRFICVIPITRFISFAFSLKKEKEIII